MQFLAVIGLTAISVAAIAVWVRRRFGPDRLLAAGIAMGACLMAVVVTAVLRTPASAGLRWTLLALVPAIVCGTVALTVAVDRVVQSSTIPDPIPETAFGAVAFLGGVLGGLLAAIFLVGLALAGARIG